MITTNCDNCNTIAQFPITVKLDRTKSRVNHFCDAGCLYWYLDSWKGGTTSLGKIISSREPDEVFRWRK